MKERSIAKKGHGNAVTILLLAYISHYIYYYNVFSGTYNEVLHLVLIALLALTVGYFVGSKYRISVSNRRKLSLRSKALSYQRQKTAAIVLVGIGILSHVLFYGTHSFGSYAEGYSATRGNGFITVFFSFWLVGMIMIEWLAKNNLIRRRLKWSNRLLMLVYVLVYFVFLTKRRQIIILFLVLFGIWEDRISRIQKRLIYIMGMILVLVFSIFGKVRGYVDTNGLMAGISYAINNFSMEWIAIDQFEGKFISRTLNDIFHYVSQYGIDPSVLVGVVFCMVPRKLLGGAKPLAFPEWYTKHFFMNDYLRGVGYAGSMVAEFYLIGGIFMLILGYFIIGYVCSRIQKYRSHTESIKDTLVYSLFIYTIILLPRYDLASLLIDTVFMYMPIVWFCGGSRRIRETTVNG